MMLEMKQKVVVIQDASRSVSLSAVKWAVQGLSLKPGDELTLLGVLHQVNTPSMFSFPGAGKFMGYKSRVDTSSMLGANQKIINDEVMKKEADYENSAEILEIRKLYEMNQIAFHRKVVPASSPKVAALEAAKKLEATWIILDRQMKKDKRYFLEKLSCGISRIKRNNCVELLRGPKSIQKSGETIEVGQVKNTEFLPGQEKQGKVSIVHETIDDEDLFSLDISPSNFRSTYYSGSNDKKEIDRGQSSLLQEDGHVIIQKESENNETSDSISNGCKIKEQINNAGETLSKKTANRVCSECTSKNLTSELKKEFTYDELHKATDGFSKQNFVSEGGFGAVYKGKLKDGQKIAVKQHKRASLQGEKEFRSEVNVLSKATHNNVVLLLGSCSERNHRLLVYEYICNGSLDIHLSKNNPNVLSWRNRMNIALGVARGLNYLHQNNIIHRDMRPNNILINHDYEPLLGDFGLAETQQDNRGHLSRNKIVGTFGYLAPEYAEKGRVSTKSDVYSFGVILLELITGQTPTDKTHGDKSLVGWTRPLLKEKKYPELIDERILENHDVHELFWMVRVAERCLYNDPDKRPSMDKMEEALNNIMSGEAVRVVEDFSPTQSSDSSFQRSNESDSERDRELQEPAIANVASTSRNRMTESIPTAMEYFSSKLPSETRNLEDLMSGKGKSYRREKSRSQILYNDMLD